MKMTFKVSFLITLLFAFITLSCSDEDMQDDLFADADQVDQEDVVEDEEEAENTAEEEAENPEESPEDPPAEEDTDEGNSNENCNPSDFIFNEEGGLLAAEFEAPSFPGAWDQDSNENGFSGDGYMVWTGSQYFGTPGNGLTRITIKINTPGTYQFIWRTAVTIGNNGTEHNDTWLRFPDADDFFGEKGSSIIYPKGVGKSPNPEGASADGWFKVYRSGNNLSFKWEALTSDNDGHKIFVKFNSPGEYTMEISARSSGHAIDKFVLFKDMSQSDAISAANELSEISCGN